VPDSEGVTSTSARYAPTKTTKFCVHPVRSTGTGSLNLFHWRLKILDIVRNGVATPLPQADQFGFFYFSDPGNPEVFVKVLDWGASTPFLIFAAGLTDFEYTVTYRNVNTGQVVVWKKNAEAFDGYANNSSLSH